MATEVITSGSTYKKIENERQDQRDSSIIKIGAGAGFAFVASKAFATDPAQNVAQRIFKLNTTNAYFKYNGVQYADLKIKPRITLGDLALDFAKVLEETRIIPQNLTLEVTESLAINDMVRMKKILSEIRNLGVRVALDDFGTGYSSLNHIREMPLDVIKIDRCFIEHLGEDDFSNAFVRMVSELANAINVRVCVEGVETKRQRDIVKKMGIRMIQGFFYGKPMKIEEFEKKYLI